VNSGRSSGGEDSVMEDLKAMGAPDDVIEAYTQEKSESDVFAVFPENWQALAVFKTLGSQWHYKMIYTEAGMISMPCGLIYTSVESVMRMQGADDTNDMFERIRIMESAALEAMAEI